MLQWRMRGYVTPEDFEGSDAQRIQQALDASHALDIGRVVLTGEYTVDKTLRIYGMTDLVLENARLIAGGDFPALINSNYFEEESRHCWSFEEKYITIRGKNSKILGDVLLYNVHHANIWDLEFGGALKFGFAREVRLYRCRFSGKNAVVLGQGANNFIIQDIDANCADTAVVMDGTLMLSSYAVGKEPEIHSVILQESRLEAPVAVSMYADRVGRIYNTQVDHLSVSNIPLALGKEGETAPEECYFNLTAEALTSDAGEKMAVFNPTKHCYFPG